MNKFAIGLIVRAAINKIGNMLYDYGNSIWIASLSTIGQTILGIYQISDLVTSIVFNPIGGAIVDRFSRRKVLMATDLICTVFCLGTSFISNDQWMVGALIVVNVIQAVAFAFSRPANKSYITEIVDKKDIVAYNSYLELILQVISVSAPVLSFIVMRFTNLRVTLMLDALSFFLSFIVVYFLPNHEPSTVQKERLTMRTVLHDIVDGFVYIRKQKEIFFLLLLASTVNFFFAALNYLLPFTDKLFGQNGAYATILSLGAIGSIVGAIIATRVTASTDRLLFSLLLTGFGVAVIGNQFFLPLPNWIAYFGNFICELFMTIFNIHFFSQVQTKVAQQYLGRVFSTIYTLSILLMPIATFFMTLFPSINFSSFLLIGLGIVIISLLFFTLFQRIER
ncbi:MFS transporter [Streptococcus sanguinis]|uniref:MFS transporter n=1 Tax=Streptococcus sanguinis TaxID=1305 RepID=A0A7H8V7P0_STRSA|nr:MFS transporter [Streptococcus sanguinis]